MEGDDALIREVQEVRRLIQQALTRAANLIAALAVAEERLATTLEQMAELQPHRAHELLAMSRHARLHAAHHRQRPNRTSAEPAGLDVPPAPVSSLRCTE